MGDRRRGAGAFANPGDLDLGLPDDETEYPGWLERGAARLVDVLGAADPEAPTWSWGTDQRVGFWSRRMAHETAVHRWDAQTANGAPEDLRPDLAVDGIDERLENLAMSMNFNEPGKEALTGAGRDGPPAPTDAPGEWLLRFGPEGFAFDREHAKGDLAVRAPASDLLLLLVGRRGLEGLETFGDPTALATHDAIRRF